MSIKLTDHDLQTLLHNNIKFADDIEARIRCGVIVALVEEVQRARRAIPLPATLSDAPSRVYRLSTGNEPDSISGYDIGLGRP